MPTILIVSAITLFIVGGIFLFFVRRRASKIRMKQALDLHLLLLRFPRIARTDQDKKDFKDEINHSAQLYSILLGLNAPFALETAVHNIGEEIHFYVGVPKGMAASVSRQIEGVFKDVQVEPIEDYNIFNSTGVSAGMYVKQRYPYALPIRTYQEANTDTFSPILSGFSNVSEIGEGVALQVLVRPAPESARKHIFSMLGQLKQGATFEDIMRGAGITIRDMQKAFIGEGGVQPTAPEQPKQINEDAVKALEMKIAKPLVFANVRLIVSATNQLQADDLLSGISQGFSQFSAPFRQELRMTKPRNMQQFYGSTHSVNSTTIKWSA
jgi:hypothetical protein